MIMESEKELLLRTLGKYEGIINLSPQATSEILKDPEKSKSARDSGTGLYVRKGHENAVHAQIFSWYSKSIALAPNDSEELALAHGNRSAFLLHIKKYDASILDIDRALALTKSKKLKIKLLCRRVQCLKGSGEYQDSKILKEAEEILKELDDEDSVKKSLNELVIHTENLKIQDKLESDDDEDETDKSKIFLEHLALKEAESPFNSVAIRHNEKYGRHLVATRDYKPGDIIMVQGIYATILDSKKYYTNCSYCFKIAWAGTPCTHCNWAMFCSEQCKEKAWAEFHDIECQIVPLSDMSRFDEVSIDFSPHAQLSIRLLIMAVREAGGLENLKSVLKAVDDTEDPVRKGFFQNGQFTGDTFSGVYALKSITSCGATSEQLSIYACRCLLLLAKLTPFFGDNERIDSVQGLLKNDSAIFVGSMLLKLMRITMINSYAYRGIDYPFHEPSDTHQDFNSKLGLGIAPLCSLINHSCYPNVRRIFTCDRKVIILCVRPINENEQIFDTYHGCFYEESKLDRLGYLEEYDFVCDCQACLENWPHMLELVKEEGKSRTKSHSEELCEVSCIRIGESLKEREFKLDENTANFFSDYITTATKEKVPTSTTCYAMFTFYEMFRALYSFRRESFGEC